MLFNLVKLLSQTRQQFAESWDPMSQDHEKPRVIVTTDMEVDDMNSTIHLALYLNMLDVEAIVYTSSQYHFLGDGLHTLGEVNPHWRTKGKRSYEMKVVPRDPDPAAGELTEYRPFPEGWIESLWSNEYADAWPTLNANALAAGEDAFPTPAEMIERTYVGNVAFEGDVREDTAGSAVIKAAILDDDPRTLWLLSWGGMNTIVRALMSIAEEYQAAQASGQNDAGEQTGNAAEASNASASPAGDHAGDAASSWTVHFASWEDVQAHVYQKVRVLGVMDGIGQDNSWLDHGAALFPELTFWRVPFVYGGYVDAVAAQPDSIELFRAPWPQEKLRQGNGPFMARYMLYGDGKRYENEPDRFQFGLTATVDWGIDGMDPIRFTPGDFMAEGDSMTYIPLLPFGLRGADDPHFNTLLGPMFKDGEPGPELDITTVGKPLQKNVNPFLRAYQEDFAARAQWCAHEPGACNHAPVIEQVSADMQVKPGELIELSATASDPDGDTLVYHWWLDTQCSDCASAYPWEALTPTANYGVPPTATPGERLVFTCAVQDEANRPTTRYAQVEAVVI